jgi:hypothetical protein
MTRHFGNWFDAEKPKCVFVSGVCLGMKRVDT